MTLEPHRFELHERTDTWLFSANVLQYHTASWILGCGGLTEAVGSQRVCWQRVSATNPQTVRGSAVLICYTVDEPWKQNPMWKKPITKDRLLWFCLYDMPRVGKPTDTECRVETAYRWSWEYTCEKILRSRFWVVGYTHVNFASYQIVFQNGAAFILLSAEYECHHRFIILFVFGSIWLLNFCQLKG